MTTISFKRTGGTMGRALDAQFDLNEMPEDVSQRIYNLLTGVGFFSIQTPPPAAMPRPDEFEYAITVEAGQTNHTVQVTDTSMPESLQPLIDDLTELAKSAAQTQEEVEDHESEHDYSD